VGLSGSILPSKPMASVDPVQFSFSGDSRNTLDTKNRISVPSKWDVPEETAFKVMPHPEHQCLVVMPPSEFTRFRDNAIVALPLERQANFLRLLGSRVETLKTDKQGRLSLGEKLCDKAGLSGEVKIIGCTERFEIWNPKAWDAFEASQEAIFKEAAISVGL